MVLLKLIRVSETNDRRNCFGPTHSGMSLVRLRRSR